MNFQGVFKIHPKEAYNSRLFNILLVYFLQIIPDCLIIFVAANRLIFFFQRNESNVIEIDEDSCRTITIVDVCWLLHYDKKNLPSLNFPQDSISSLFVLDSLLLGKVQDLNCYRYI
jgi:hypothetical protein